MRPLYRLDELGWLQFERLCSLVLQDDAGLTELPWLGRADRGRLAVDAQSSVVVIWAPAMGDADARLGVLAWKLSQLPADAGITLGDRVLVLTNLGSEQAAEALRASAIANTARATVWGCEELSDAIDRHPAIRAAMPSVLGLRELAPLVPPSLRARSSFQVERAQALARVFWPTRAHQRALEVLARHRFVVLTGPPEMGKTAIAQMVGLAKLTCGWEVHDCTSPDQLWRMFDCSRPQVFIADDAFGSTEYRPDAADRWAAALAGVLSALGADHWLIWTSRPAPLKAGLRRVQREQGAERFPAPHEVLVDATDLDLAEKTMILFRHAKARGASAQARRLLRSAAVTIVEHPHFTPERIRRFVSDRLDAVPELLLEDSEWRWLREVDRQLSTPTEAMRTSFAALEAEHRELLISLLDAPAGMIDERELARIARRHLAAGLNRPAAEMIDRLTDHFVRVTPLGVDWVHPSWRDLVIEQLAEEPAARRRFIASSGIDGLALALSREGGAAGERSFPLLRSDSDWDALADRLTDLLQTFEDQDLARIMAVLGEAVTDDPVSPEWREPTALARLVLVAAARRWDRERRPVPAFLLDAWYRLEDSAAGDVEPPALALSWAELHPASPTATGLERSELVRADEWLTLAGTLALHDPAGLSALGFFGPDQEFLRQLIGAVRQTTDADCRPLARSVLVRIQEVAPRLRRVAELADQLVEFDAGNAHWWVPEDLAAPPTRERILSGPVEFTREDVDRVLSDL
jgi:hypothetical protein